MEGLHHRLIRIGLEALAEDFGYRLAGGYAVQAHRLVSRVSDDVDLFTPIGRAEGELPQAIARLVEAYRTAGYLVEVTQQAQVYARLHVTDPDSGSQSKVELVGDLLHHPPVESDLGPVLHLDDLAAAKTGALFGRAEVRDATDVNALLKVGYTRARLLELAARNEAEPISTTTRPPSPASSTTPTGSSPHTASTPRPQPRSARSSPPGTANSPSESEPRAR
ncbi:nucleotidyl transferase AbiEii/AbiGii toxin family protein [Streptomyces sp. G-G2]|uniref:nucleotidyl transferase AbiEii/AbiGii toxin family protein n=1 Tax=Streptomyces sp. G-G2 TaxID=3046201 RepID=UPI0024BB20C1|nr:nucleotidyl transferase AbiEii/AbiGii toxin family protein [Streptomyces sp. G-G2]MDJ0384830.1 nucleotidyl transferase AbiEii/AbiGii toxin family protein [Streptomyces sp. G-G2]